MRVFFKTAFALQSRTGMLRGIGEKKPSVAFFSRKFSAKTYPFLLQTNDAPSLALLVAKQCRNPGKPVENGLFVDFRDKTKGRACEITVRKRKIWRGDCRFFAFLPII